MKMTEKNPSNIILHKNRYNESTGKSFQLNEVIKYIAWLALPQITQHILYVKKN